MICEYCVKEHDGSYGSGRFCSTKCSHGFSTKSKRKEINRKVSKRLRKYPLKYCVECGNSIHSLNKFGVCRECINKRCKSDVEIMRDVRYKKKRMAVEYKGGKCNICGYEKCLSALDFHHKNPQEKVFSINGNGLCLSWKKTKEELDKCVLLCANCHREAHNGITLID